MLTIAPRASSALVSEYSGFRGLFRAAGFLALIVLALIVDGARRPYPGALEIAAASGTIEGRRS